jgi:large subunit ribosomal protein L15
VRLSELNTVQADVIDLEALKAADIISQNTLRAKVFLSGELKKAVTIKGLAVTKGATAAIEAAGGSIQE